MDFRTVKNRVFHYFHHPFWGKTPYFWKHPNDRSHGFFFEVPSSSPQDDPDTQQRLLGQLYSVMDVNPSGSEMVRSASSIFFIFLELGKKRWKPLANELNRFLFLLSLHYVDIIIYTSLYKSYIYTYMIYGCLYLHTHMNFIMICKNELSSPSDSTESSPRWILADDEARQAWWLLASAVAATNLLEPLGMPAIHWGMGKPTKKKT